MPLPKLERTLAHLTGTVEIRCTTFPVRARWLSVELEKIEVVPPSAQHGHGDGFGNHHNKRNKKSKGGRHDTATGGPQDEAKFVELIGTGPSKLWEATATATGSGLRPVISISTSSVYPPPQRSSTYKNNNRHWKKSTLGAKLGSVFSRSRSSASSARSMGHVPTFQGDQEEDDEEEVDGGVDEDGYGVIPEGSYPFSIPLPEGLPPSVEIEDSAAVGFRRSGGLKGISYQIVASLAVKPPKK